MKTHTWTAFLFLPRPSRRRANGDHSSRLLVGSHCALPCEAAVRETTPARTAPAVGRRPVRSTIRFPQGRRDQGRGHGLDHQCASVSSWRPLSTDSHQHAHRQSPFLRLPELSMPR